MSKCVDCGRSFGFTLKHHAFQCSNCEGQQRMNTKFNLGQAEEKLYTLADLSEAEKRGEERGWEAARFGMVYCDVRNHCEWETIAEWRKGKEIPVQIRRKVE